LIRIETQALILDLDDTLYLERDYVRSGFDAVGRYVAERHGVPGFGERCWTLFERGVRDTTFDDALREAGLSGSVECADLVDVYRRHTPSIHLQQDTEHFLREWPADRPLGLITDGPVESQSAKISALELKDRLSPIVLSDEWGAEFRKPHDRPFEAVEQALGLAPDQLTYIADNPRKDFIAPRRRGWQTVRMKRPGGEHSGVEDLGDWPAHAEVTSFAELTW
jgi:putative hydrolase of the HAD superfamily